MSAGGRAPSGSPRGTTFQSDGSPAWTARKGDGHTIVECKTYRWHGHFEGDAQTYKATEEVEEWKKRDPIPSFKNRLIEMGTITASDYDAITAEITSEIDNAVTFAEQSPFPSPEETLEDVFA